MLTDDSINSPKHYVEGRTIEPIDVIEDWKLSFHLGNALKYLSRAGRKGSEVEDINKAIWYMRRHVQFLNTFGYDPVIAAKPVPDLFRQPYPLGPTPVPKGWWSNPNSRINWRG